MNAVPGAVRAGLSRGWIEIRHSMTDVQEWTYSVVMNVILVAVLLAQRGSTLDGTTLSLAAFTLPSLIGMMIVFGGLMGAATVLSADREDGTLLRAKATPHGMAGYLVARLVLTSYNTATTIVVLLLAGVLAVGGLPTAAAAWLTLAWVVVLGLLATLPWGAIIGSLVKSSSSGFGWTFLIIGGLTAISGIFYPISALPGWLHPVAQVFPLYWLGLGMRSAMLPDAAAAVEITGSWRHLETLGVLGAWALVGLLLAPAILRRMARRESGSTVEARKQRVLQRGY
jgi:ABC-2 type transport system permease protein